MVDFFFAKEVVFHGAFVVASAEEGSSGIRELFVGLVMQDMSRTPESNIMIFLFILRIPSCDRLKRQSL